MQERNSFQEMGIDFEYSRLSVFSEVMFLKNPINVKSQCVIMFLAKFVRVNEHCRGGERKQCAKKAGI